METRYDFIVIGAGSSGCVIAARLTEDPNISVLLLEAGPSDEDHPEIYDPKNVPVLKKTCLDWNFKTEPQKHAYKGFKEDGVATWPRGKVLGGSSSINHMLYVRGDAADYDSWEKHGCTGWGWKDVFPYLLKLENCRSSRYRYYPYRHREGPIEVTNAPQMIDDQVAEATSAFIKAGIELGYKEIDTNCGHALGFGLIEKNIDHSGQRCNTVKGYLNPARERPNLTVVTGAHVLKINFRDIEAVGVLYLQNGREIKVAANKEVILSAGAIGSPQILMLSGIGPKSHLSEIGIQCIADLQVGFNLQDHMFTELRATVSEEANVLTCDKAMQGHAIGGGFGYLQTNVETGESWPDVQLIFLPELYAEGADPNKAAIASQLKSPRFFSYFGYDYPKEERQSKKGVCIHVTPSHPKSIGYIKLRSTDALSPPIIQPNYLQDPQDLAIFCESFRLVKKILKTKAMRHMSPELISLQMTDTKYEEFSDENLSLFARHFTYTSYHPVGTCKMGACDDDTAVVDPELRVRGIKGLRVVDASIMPHLTTANTNVPSMMIGEKGADIIKQNLYK